jgi:hypothetical protein
MRQENHVTEAQIRMLQQVFGMLDTSDIERNLDAIIRLGLKAQEQRHELKALFETETDPLAQTLLIIKINAAIQTELDVHDVVAAIKSVLDEIKRKEAAA